MYIRSPPSEPAMVLRYRGTKQALGAVPGKFLGILYMLGQDPSDSKSNRLHVHIIFRFYFHSFEVSSIAQGGKTLGNLKERHKCIPGVTLMKFIVINSNCLARN